MKRIHVINLEEYHPSYRDRELKWAKIYFRIMSGDDEFEALHEIDRSRYIAFILLEVQNKKPIPYMETYFVRKGFDLNIRSLEKTLDNLSRWIEIIDDGEKYSESISENPHNIPTKKGDTDKEVGADCPYETIKECWNNICVKLPAIHQISDIRRRHIKARWKQFNYNLSTIIDIFKKIHESDFCHGKNDRQWKASIDWVISNDNNMVKILEGKYDNKIDLNKKNREDVVTKINQQIKQADRTMPKEAKDEIDKLLGRKKIIEESVEDDETIF